MACVKVRGIIDRRTWAAEGEWKGSVSVDWWPCGNSSGQGAVSGLVALWELEWKGTNMVVVKLYPTCVWLHFESAW